MSTHVNDPNQAIESAQLESPQNQGTQNESAQPDSQPVSEPIATPEPGVVAEPADNVDLAAHAVHAVQAAQEARSRESRLRLITEAVTNANAADVRAVANIADALAQADPECANLVDDAALRAKLDALVARVRLSHPALFITTPEVARLAPSMTAAAAPGESARAHFTHVESRARATNDRRALLEYLRARRGAVALR